MYSLLGPMSDSDCTAVPDVGILGSNAAPMVLVDDELSLNAACCRFFANNVILPGGAVTSDAVGSKDTSQHRIGCAADIKVTGMSPREVVQACIDAKLPYDQVIEEFSSWTHISVPDMPSRPPRRQALTIDNAGTRLFK